LHLHGKYCVHGVVYIFIHNVQYLVLWQNILGVGVTPERA